MLKFLRSCIMVFFVGAQMPIYATQPLSTAKIIQQDQFRWVSLHTSSSSPPSPKSIRRAQRAIEGRTSVKLSDKQHWILYEPETFAHRPFLHWEMCGLPPELTEEDQWHWRDFFNAGGFLYLDMCSSNTSDFRQWQHFLQSIFTGSHWEAVSSKDVLSFSFYLMNAQILKDRGNPRVWQLQDTGRAIMVMNTHPAMSWSAFNQSKPSAGSNSGITEETLHFYINLLMYALSGHYKEDQMHLPTILLRRR